MVFLASRIEQGWFICKIHVMWSNLVSYTLLFNVWGCKGFSCSPMLQLFDQNDTKTVILLNITILYFLFEYIKKILIWVFSSLFCLAWFLRNHSNLLIRSSRTFFIYEQYWKQLCISTVLVIIHNKKNYLTETCHSICIVLLLLVLIASIVLICKSLWIKASAKWLNVNLND